MPLSGAVTATETWTGSNGASWPVQWTLNLPSGAAADIQANTGRLQTSAGSYTACSATLDESDVTDGGVLVKVIPQGPLTEQYAAITLRGVGLSSDSYKGETGYIFEIQPAWDWVKVIRRVSGTETILMETGYTFTAGVPLWVLAQVSGSTVQFKLWNDGSSEPGTWLHDATDASPITAAGKAYLGSLSGGTATATEIRFDDFSRSDEAAPAGPPLDITDVGTSAWAAPANSTSIAVAYPAGIGEGDVLYAVLHTKPNTATPATPTDWTQVASVTGGGGAQGAGTGQTRITVFKRIVPSGGLSGSQTFSVSGGSSLVGHMRAVRAPAGATDLTWSEVFSSFSRSTASTTFGGTTTGTLAVAEKDHVIAVVGAPDDQSSTITISDLTVSGVTFGTLAQSPTGTIINAQGNDISAASAHRIATGGSGTAAAVVTASGSSSETGLGLVMRVRLTGIASANLSGTGTFAGSGTLAAAGGAAASEAATFTGSGTFAGIGAPSPTGSPTTFGGVGTLAASGTPVEVRTGTAVFAGGGSLAATGTPRPAGAAGFAGAGSLAITPGSVTTGGAGQFAGAGTLTAAGSPTVQAVRAFTGSGILAGSGTKLETPATPTNVTADPVDNAAQVTWGTSPGATSYTLEWQEVVETDFSGAATLAGSGNLAAGGVPRPAGAVSFGGSGGLSTVSTPHPAAHASASGSGSLVATGSLSGVGAASTTGSGQLTTAGTPRATGVVNLTGAGALTAVGGTAAVSGAAGFTGSGVVNASGTAAQGGAGSTNLTGTGTLVASGTSKPTGVAALTGEGGIITVRLVALGQGATFAGSGVFTATGRAKFDYFPGTRVPGVATLIYREAVATLTDSRATATLTQHPAATTALTATPNATTQLAYAESSADLGYTEGAVSLTERIGNAELLTTERA